MHNLLLSTCPICQYQHPQRALICEDCQSLMPWRNHSCAQCHRGIPTHATHCANCLRQPPPWQQLVAPFAYQGIIQTMIKTFKYHQTHHWGRWLTNALYDQLHTRTAALWPQALLPIPLHRDKLRRRGFNQAHEIAKILSKRLSTPIANKLCVRTEQRLPQHGMRAKQRALNLRGIFTCHARAPKHIALIDDICTTGSTFAELSNTLKQAGADHIECWCLAVTPLGANRP